jgi:signal transduction histidine kinase
MAPSLTKQRVRSPAGVIPLLLAGVLAAAAALTWEAARAARAERATAESVLREYAGFAAWEFTRTVRSDVERALDSLFSNLTQLERTHGIEQMFAAHAKEQAACGCHTAPAGVRSFVHLSMASGDMRTGGEPIDESARAALLELGAQQTHPNLQVRFVDSAGRRELLISRREPGARGDILHAAVAELSLLTNILARVADRAPLLPPTLTARAETSQVLSIQVHDPSGQQLYASQVAPSAYAARSTLDKHLGGLAVTTALAPDAAASLVIGGLPSSRLPWLYGLVALTGLLIAVAVLQLRRQMQLVRLRGEFISGVSHELRTPLAQIRMFAETLALGRVRTPHESRRSLEIILREAHRLTHLIDNVLSFSRAERGAVALAQRPMAVRQLVDELTETMEPFAAARRASLRVEVEDDLTCVMDPGAVRQMLLNLIDNALKYGPEGQTITISARRDNGVIVFAVADEGPGIPEGLAARIWEPFWRAPGSAQGGSGIGLAIVRDLSAAHNGRAYVDPRTTRGARFVIELPDAA